MSPRRASSHAITHDHLQLTPRRYGHPDARALTAALHAEQLARYGTADDPGGTSPAELLILETGARNTEAIALYARAGFRPIPAYVPGRDPRINRAFAKPLPPAPTPSGATRRGGAASWPSG